MTVNNNKKSRLKNGLKIPVRREFNKPGRVLPEMVHKIPASVFEQTKEKVDERIFEYYVQLFFLS